MAIQNKLTHSGLSAPGRGNAILSRYGAFLDVLIHAADFMVVWGCALLSRWLRYGSLAIPPRDIISLSLVSLLTLIVFQGSGIYRNWRGESLLNEILRIWLAWSAIFVIFLFILWASKTTAEYSRLWLGLWFVIAAVTFAIVRWVTQVILGNIRKRGIDTRTVVIVGATVGAVQVVNAVRHNVWSGLQVVGYVATLHDEASFDDLVCLGNADTYLASTRENLPDQIWLALPLSAEKLIQSYLETLEQMPITVRLVPNLFGFGLLNHHVTELAGVPVLTLRGTPMEGHAYMWKTIEDKILSTVILLCLSPLLLLIAVGIKLSSPGPVLYRQKRLGWNGRPFEMLKFRSMLQDVEQEDVRWGSAASKKVTPFGRFLRRTSLDELPQFINVIKGDMSIVGPRPERPIFVEQFKSHIAGYMQKHFVKAGITGWAQINGWRGDTDLQMRIEHDLYYIENWSILFDLKIILMTLVRGFVHKNAL